MKKIACCLIISIILSGCATYDLAEDNFDNYFKETYLKDPKSEDNMIMNMRDRLKSDPNNPTYLYNLGHSYYLCELYDDAVEPLEKAKILEPKAFDICITLSAVYFGLHKYQEAERGFKEAIALKPKDIDSHVGLARVYKRVGDKNKYDEQLNIIEKINKKKANELSKQMEEEYEQKKEYNSELSSQDTKKAADLIIAGKYWDATKECNKAIESDPNNSTAYYNMGIALKHLGMYHKALAFYKQAVYLDPEDVNTYINMGSIYLTTGRENEAINVLRKAISINSNIPETYSNLGLAYKELGNIKEAKESFIKALPLFESQGRNKDVDAVNRLLKEIE